MQRVLSYCMSDEQQTNNIFFIWLDYVNLVIKLSAAFFSPVKNYLGDFLYL